MKQVTFPNIEHCTYPNCDGIKVPDGRGWRCTKGGRYHYLWVRAQLIRRLQKVYYATPLDKLSTLRRYWENIRRNQGGLVGWNPPIFVNKETSVKPNTP